VVHAPPILRLADRQRLDVGVVVGDFEPAELAVTAAGKERRVDEVAECALTGVEQARDLVVREIANDRGIDVDARHTAGHNGKLTQVPATK
jgi:hypothetical protein